MIPGPIKANVRERSVGEKDVLDVLNREVIPTLRAVRDSLNALLSHLGTPVELTGSRADPEQALAAVIGLLEGLELAEDSTTP